MTTADHSHSGTSLVRVGIAVSLLANVLLFVGGVLIVFVFPSATLPSAVSLASPPLRDTEQPVCAGDTIRFQGELGIDEAALLMRVRVWYRVLDDGRVVPVAPSTTPEYFAPAPYEPRPVPLSVDIPATFAPGSYELHVAIFDFVSSGLEWYSVPIEVTDCPD